MQKLRANCHSWLINTTVDILHETLLPLYPFYVILTILVRCLVKGPNLGEERGELHYGKLRDSQARRRSKWNDREETGAGRYREEGRVETQRQSDKQVRQSGRYQASGRLGGEQRFGENKRDRKQEITAEMRWRLEMRRRRQKRNAGESNTGAESGGFFSTCGGD